MKPANAKARALFEKLERLADPSNGGTPDEIDTANRKLQRLKARFDFSGAPPVQTTDIFSGIQCKRRFRRAAHVHTFLRTDFDIANSVKWAIETATGAPCVFRGWDLLAEVPASTANKLAKVALHIAQSFQTLLERFGRLHGVTAHDRSLFVRGLYDGMMNDGRGIGQPLPRAAVSGAKQTKPRNGALQRRPSLAVHPYTVALGLGKQIRFAVPLAEITAELERTTQAAIGAIGSAS